MAIISRLSFLILLCAAFPALPHAEVRDCEWEGSCPAKGHDLIQKRNVRESETEKATEGMQLMEMVGDVAFYTNVAPPSTESENDTWMLMFPDGVTDKEEHAYAEKMKAAGISCTYEGHPSEGGIAMITANADKMTLQEFVRTNNKPGPDYVAQDTEVTPIPELPVDKDEASLLEQSHDPPTWGLDRIDDDFGTDGSYHPPGDGQGVHVYVVDTGIRIDHDDFGGRAKAALEWNFRGKRVCDPLDKRCAADTHGHGTHCAGTVGGTKWGVAKKANLYAVKTLWPSGKTSWIAGAMDWVVTNAPRPAVLSMSLGGPGNPPAYRTAVNAATNSGVTVVIAAGNSNSDARKFAPAFVPAAITVGSTTSTDSMSGFSNYGPVVDIFAPGSDIVSASARSVSRTGSVKMSGTSMACPHVAGAVAVLLQFHPDWTPAQIANFLDVTSTKGKITGLPQGTPNKLLMLSLAAFNVTTTTTTFPGATGYGFYVTEGPCINDMATGCVTSDGFKEGGSGQYSHYGACKLQPAPHGGKLHFASFATEAKWDYLLVQGMKLTGNLQDQAIKSMEGTTLNRPIEWKSDNSVAKAGWKICNLNPSLPTTTFTTTTTLTSAYTFEVIFGPCQVDATTGCATSDRYPNVYSNGGYCRLRPTPYGKIHIVDFMTERFKDELLVEGRWYSGAITDGIGALEGKVFTEPIRWDPGNSGQARGWKICNMPLNQNATEPVTTPQPTVPVTTAQATEPATSAEPTSTTLVATTTTTTTTTMGTTIGFRWISGPCIVDAAGCATSPGYPGTYQSHETCSMSASKGKLLIVAFKTEVYDRLTLNGRNYSGDATNGKNAILALNGTSVEGDVAWHSDESVEKNGWKLCIMPETHAQSSSWFR